MADQSASERAFAKLLSAERELDRCRNAMTASTFSGRQRTDAAREAVTKAHLDYQATLDAVPVTTRVHVNRINIALNNQDNGNRPVFTVTQGDTVTHAHGVRLLGPSRMLYDAEQETSDGARAWIETEAPVELVGG